MKKLLLIFAIIAIFSANANAEWTNLYKDDKMHYRCIDLECVGDRCIGIFEANLTYPMVRYTTDAGYSWKTAFIDSSKHQLWDIEYVAEDFCMIGADSGIYYVSYDGFETWEKKREMGIRINYKIAFADQKHGAYITSWLLSWDPPYPIQYLVSVTHDGTETWFESTPDFSDIEGNTYIDEMKWLSPKDFYVFAFNFTHRGHIFHSSDSGRSYKLLAKYQDRFLDVHFLNETDWVGVGHRSITNKDKIKYQIISKTTDGGKSWERKLDTTRNSNNSLKKVVFYDDKKGAAHTYTSWDMYYTYDGGETWHVDKKYDLDYGQGYGLDNMLSGCDFDSKGNLIGCGYLFGSVWRQDFLTSVKETEAFGEIRIYPNPIPLGRAATISLHIDHPGMYSFSVFSLDGRLLDSYQTFLHTAQNTIEYQPENLPRGNYFLFISGGGGEASVKMVVE